MIIMNQMNTPMDNNILRYEVIERIIRFDIHLDEIREQFYNDNINKQTLIDDFKNELMKLYSIITIDYESDTSFLMRYDLVQNAINELHLKHLNILPRPSVPVELTRFERVIKEQVVILNKEDDKFNVSIDINENIGETIENDYLSAYKQYAKREYELIQGSNKSIYVDIKEKSNENKSSLLISITIPRIDASNTFRWPSLIHEVCHHILKNNIKFGRDENIEKSFLSFLGTTDKNKIFDSLFEEEKEKGSKDKYSSQNTTETTCPNLENWLSECFCDLLACMLIGPSFYFSQFTVFLNINKPANVTTHPPHQFRLELIKSFIIRRFPSLYGKDKDKDKELSICTRIINEIQKQDTYTFDNKPILNTVFTSFNDYFSRLLLEHGGIKGNEDIANNLKELVNTYVVMDSDVIDSLTERLKDGLPIPSIKTRNSDGVYEEVPTYVQEIFLASWLVKLSPSEKTLKLITKNDKNTYEELKTKIIRHDQAVLKSIQVSEWFYMLLDGKKREDNIKLFRYDKTTDKEYKLMAKSVLVDKEIKSLIYKDELKIIPLMYNGVSINNKFREQIGTTSIDVRLGTSFQVFYPDQYGIIDFANPANTYSFRKSSKRIDLDFLEGITIAPGQFILAHSMEYIQLPNYICGNLEGRSSFARLGLEIHMTAGFIDPGFEGVITFEIYNAGPTTIRLYPGMRIGQLRFEQNSEPEKPYDKQNVKYKGLLEHNVSLQSKDIEVEIIKNKLIDLKE